MMIRVPANWRRVIIFIAALVPLMLLTRDVMSGNAGADPAKTIVLNTGTWTIYFLFITLAVTPLRRWLRWNWLASHRRMLGLFALFYALLHVLAYLIFILGLDVSKLMAELIKRPYITAGAPAVAILIVLGITSTKNMMRRLGKRWVKLHRLIYLATLLAWVHVLWQVRASYQDAVIYGAITLVLLGVRLLWWYKKRADTVHP
jgi:sulfoxide reductase heme-binding subunit YedZ